jgi:hypothetical protein
MAKNRMLRLALAAMAAFMLISWGRVGHQAVGYIAEAHLTPKTAQMIKGLLGNETLADVSTYPDEIRYDSFFYFTWPWHYIDVPAGENFDQFTASVYQMTEPNLYGVLRHWERVLSDPKASASIKIFALKWVVHQIGDLHQPLHVARAADKGGNTVPVWFENDSTSLHWLWDTNLIEHRGLSSKDFAKLCDIASPEDIKKWQADPLINWLYESNQITSRIYAEDPRGKRLGEDYYNEYITLIEERIDQAGIRLAGVLNQCFDPPGATAPVDTTVCDKVFDGKYLEGKQITFLNLGGFYPNQKLSVVIKGSVRGQFPSPPETLYAGKTICVKGPVEFFNGRPEIIVTDPKQITMP